MRRIDIFNEEAQLEAQVQESVQLHPAQNNSTNNSPASVTGQENEIAQIDSLEVSDSAKNDQLSSNAPTPMPIEQNTVPQNDNGTAIIAPDTRQDSDNLDLEIEYHKESSKDGITVLLLILSLGTFGVHRFYIGRLRLLGLLYFVLLGIPQILLIILGLVSGTMFLPPLVMQTSETITNYSWLTTYWSYARYVAIIMLALESLMILRGRVHDEDNSVIRIKGSEEIFAYLLFAIVLMIALFGYLGTQEAKKHEDPILKKIYDIRRYSN